MINNIPPNIESKIGKNIYKIPNHPICIIKKKIYDFFDNKREIFEGLNPFVDIQNNFDDLLIEKSHPSRSYSDTFYFNERTVLRTHTSAHQTQFLKEGRTNFLVTGDVYRKDEVDAFHYPIFHQMEGVSVLGSNHDAQSVLNIAKNELSKLIEYLFPNCKYKFVDTYFPFTEPSFEIEVFLNEKWVEVLGAGVIRQEILNSCKITNNFGWAFGLGLERLAMIFFQIPDIRYFWTDDKRFLEQFKEGEITSFKEYSKYPSVIRDISFYYPDNFIENDFYTLAKEMAGDTLERIELIDKFHNPKNFKNSFSFRMFFSSLDRTLTSEEVSVIIELLKSNLTGFQDIELR